MGTSELLLFSGERLSGRHRGATAQALRRLSDDAPPPASAGPSRAAPLRGPARRASHPPLPPRTTMELFTTRDGLLRLAGVTLGAVGVIMIAGLLLDYK